MKGQFLLPNDLTFLDVLLNGLYEKPLEEKDRHCVLHPVRKQHMVYNAITDYCADMGILLAYYKMLDDVRDDKSVRAATYAKTLKKQAEKIIEEYPRQSGVVSECLDALHECEEKEEYDLDRVAGFTGRMTGEVFVMKEDLWADDLRRMGFYLGKYIYLLDAYDDLEKDEKKHRYNPWEPVKDRRDFEALVENTLTMMMAECAKSFEKLPILQDIAILRNIVYSGVWVKYREIQKKRAEKGKE